MNALAPVTPKLVKLIPMLGTDKSGELVATVHAIRRTLESAGCDLHDLAIVIERSALPVVVDIDHQEPKAALRPWQDTALQCLHHGAGKLRPAEADFLRLMLTWPSEPSEKQARWLDAIASALDIEVTA
jgi:hypothetical protein